MWRGQLARPVHQKEIAVVVLKIFWPPAPLSTQLIGRSLRPPSVIARERERKERVVCDDRRWPRRCCCCCCGGPRRKAHSPTNKTSFEISQEMDTYLYTLTKSSTRSVMRGGERERVYIIGQVKTRGRGRNPFVPHSDSGGVASGWLYEQEGAVSVCWQGGIMYAYSLKRLGGRQFIKSDICRIENETYLFSMKEFKFEIFQYFFINVQFVVFMLLKITSA